MQTFRKAAENLRVLIFRLVLTTLLPHYLLFNVPKAKVHENLFGGTEFQYSFEKSCLSHKFFGTLSLVAVSRQKGRSRVLNPWTTARKSGGPQTFGYFNNRFASRMRLSNSCAYEPPYRLAPMNWRGIKLIFFWKSTPIPPANWPSSALERQ